MEVMTGSSYRPKLGFDIRIKPGSPKKKPAATSVRRCAVKDCGEGAEAKVPKSKQGDEGIWLCRKHLQVRNARWNFFQGMSAEEIERYRIEAITGHRPTWPLGQRAAEKKKKKVPEEWAYEFVDAFAVLEENADLPKGPKRSRLTKLQLDALVALNLEEGATLIEVKARYKELVKRFHPDANGGDRSTEERLKQVIRAYRTLAAANLG